MNRAALYLALSFAARLGSSAPPNIIYILTDDAGFGSWPSDYIKTPALDALAVNYQLNRPVSRVGAVAPELLAPELLAHPRKKASGYPSSTVFNSVPPAVRASSPAAGPGACRMRA
jgi:hypothetical protein